MVFRKIVPIGVLFFALSGCGSSQDNSLRQSETPILCGTQTEKNESLWQLLNEVYLWNEDLDANTNPADFNSITALMDDVKAKNPIDRFSRVSQSGQGSFDDIIDGTVKDNGIAALISEEELLAAIVWPNSPASKLGIKRGDKIIQVAGNEIASILNSSSEPQATIDSLFSSSNKIEVMWQNQFGTSHEGTLEKREFSIETVLHLDVIDTGQSKVGYMVFMLFIPNSIDNLNAAFQTLIDAQVDHLIIDLRYNGGGCCMETQLESQIAGDNVLGKLAETKSFNKNRSHMDFARDFALNNSIAGLDMKSVTFLTTRRTASAAEGIMINLAPYIDVKLVGETTYGKTAGQVGYNICGETVYISEFTVKNADGLSIPADGLAPTCVVKDTFKEDWGDLADPLLSEALYLHQQGHCSM